MDSNHRFLSQEKPAYVAEGELRGDRTGHQRNLRGTDVSNPSPSTRESDELPIARLLDLLTASTEPSPNQSSRCSAPGRCASERSGSRPNHEPRLAVPTDKRALHKGKPRRGTPGFSGRTIGIGEHRSPASIKQQRAAIVQVDNFWVRCRPARCYIPILDS